VHVDRGSAACADPRDSLQGMTETPASKRVLLIGLHPRAVDFTAVEGLDEAKLTAGLVLARDGLLTAGFAAEWCLIDADWASAEPMLSAALAAGPLAAVMIGAGIRVIPGQFLLFEQIVNLVHERAPHARLCFNTSPTSTLEAVLRWVRP
jgi:hypothetical protein